MQHQNTRAGVHTKERRLLYIMCMNGSTAKFGVRYQESVAKAGLPPIKPRHDGCGHMGPVVRFRTVFFVSNQGPPLDEEVRHVHFLFYFFNIEKPNFQAKTI